MDSKVKKTCGLVMPISAIDGCSSEHWKEVKDIITTALISCSEFDFEVKLVSDSDEVGVIQKRIVQNIYSSDVIVCDVSGKNPNVMFELGLRLAFDKPTIIVKDDKTDYSFDTGVIEHISYRRDLRFSNITAFKDVLRDKVTATIKESEKNPDHSTFLKNFGTFQVASLKESEVSSEKLLIEMVQDLQGEVSSLRHQSAGNFSNQRVSSRFRAKVRSEIRRWIASNEEPDNIRELVNNHNFVSEIEKRTDAPGSCSSPDQFYFILDEELEMMSA